MNIWFVFLHVVTLIKKNMIILVKKMIEIGLPTKIEYYKNVSCNHAPYISNTRRVCTL